MDEIIDVSPYADDVAVRCDRGVSLVPRADRLHHAPDRLVLAVRHGSLVGRCSCWWSTTAWLDGLRTGAIGHYAASTPDAGEAMLARACRLLGAAGCAIAVGPMDGATWRRYRFITDRGTEPLFFLEPDYAESWPNHWSAAGFSPLASYTSAVTADLRSLDSRSKDDATCLAAHGITIRAFDTARADEELRRIFRLASVSFSRNFLYSPIPEAEFLAQHRALLPFVRPELVLLAERARDLLGLVFALPDVLQQRRGADVDTIIVKTLAVHPGVSGKGLGGALVASIHGAARALGYRRAIHALMHETNVSRRLSDRRARTFRRYALLSRSLRP
jgi:GNAT superfamily N-acetyltransferase